MRTCSTDISTFINDAEVLSEKVDLFYAQEEEFRIERKNTKPFTYFLEGKLYDDSKRLKEISSLAIPPAWQNVRIAYSFQAHLQAVGRDKKSRKQYRYHPKWQQVRNRTKFAKLPLFGQYLPNIRAQVEQDLRQEHWTKSKILALIIKLMEETHIRIGNEQYARHNETYGLTTLRKRHVSHGVKKLRFEFVGKRGKKHKITLRNKRLVRLVNQCEEIPGWELFKFFDEDGNKQSIDSGMVNEYIQRLSQPIFSAKDFRTWAASLVFYKELKARHDETSTMNTKLIIKDALKSAASALGNTPNVCRKYYVHPVLINGYEKKPAELVSVMPTERTAFLQTSEVEMLTFIKSNNFQIINK